MYVSRLARGLEACRLRVFIYKLTARERGRVRELICVTAAPATEIREPAIGNSRTLSSLRTDTSSVSRDVPYGVSP